MKPAKIMTSYQVRYGILYAGHYGSPQLRRRVIFIASKRGIHLPDLPQPSHVASNIRLLNVLVGEDHAFTVSRRRMDSAPLGAVTVKDMIGDLPAWEW
jgi:DNA (cytosine-5)-methyltransferase 1